MMYQLNLLPHERKQRLKMEILARSGVSTLLLFVLISLGVSIALFAVSSMLSSTLRSQQQQTRRVADATLRQQGELPQDSIRQLNAFAARIAAMQKLHVAVVPLLAFITGLVPDGIVVQTMDIDTQQLSLSMTGTAATRQTLLALEANFSSSEKLKNVTSPVTNLLERENIPFSINATIVLP